MQDNKSKIICCSCLDGFKNVPDNSIDLILTDPPYNLAAFMKKRVFGLDRMRENTFVEAGWDEIQIDEWEKLIKEFLKESFRVLKKGGSFVCFMSIMKLQDFIQWSEDVGFYYKTVGIWHKSNPMPRNMKYHFVNSTEPWMYFIKGARTGTFNHEGKCIHDFIETVVTPVGEKKCGKHPTQKPLTLMEHFVKILTNEGDTVLDPFAGSGSSIIAAKNLNRKGIGFELNEKYAALGNARLKAGTDALLHSIDVVDK